MAHIARKRFGQHFLADNTVIQRIVQAIRPRAGEKIAEIGPGQAALTQALLDHVPHLDVIELDRDLVVWLRNKFGVERLTIHEGDVLAFDFTQLPSPLRVVGNLPYNISTPLMVKLISVRHLLIDQHYMLQKEVVERICASPDSAAYGRLTVLMQAYFETEHLFNVGPESFDPPPRVDSAIIRLTPSQHSASQIRVATLEGLLGAAFNQRRKMIRTTLLPWLRQQGLSLVDVGLDGTMRPENISVPIYLELAMKLEAARGQ
jgi:16S rRNA (adenine1518-N6/adenine1519-N6)-dimethyltransferase